MSLDAGNITTEAQLDLSKFEASVTRLEAAIARVDKDMASIPDARPQLDSGPFVTGSARLKEQIAGLNTQIGVLSIVPALGLVGAVTAGSTALVAITKQAFDLGKAFDDASDRIRITTGATGDRLRGLQRDFEAVFTSIPTSMKEASEAISILNVRLGLTGDDLQTVSKQVLELSRLTGSDAATNARLAARAFQDWGVAVKDQADTLDLFFRASQASGISVTRLQELLVQFGAPLRGLGFEMEEVVAIIAKFEKEGVNTEQALGAMRIALARLSEAGLPAREALQDIIDAIQNADDATAAAQLGFAAFGERAGAEISQAIREGRLELGDFVKELKEGSETIADAASDTEDAAERWRLAMNRLAVTFKPVGDGVFNIAANITEHLIPAIDEIIRRASDPKLQAFLAQLAQGAFQGPTGLGVAALGVATQAITGTAIDTVQQGLADDAAAAAHEGETRALIGLTEAEKALVLARIEQVRAQELEEQQARETTQVMEDQTEAQDKATEKTSEATDKARDLIRQLKGLKDEVKSFEQQLAEAGQDTALIERLIQQKAEAEEVDKAIGSLVDTSLAAYIVTLRNIANTTTDAEEASRAWAEATALATEHLVAQKATSEEAARAGAEAAKEQQAIFDAIAKAAKVADDEATEAFTNVAKVLSNDLDPATRQQVQQLLILGQAEDAARIAGERFGLTQQDMARLTEGTTRQIAEQIERLKAFAEVSASAFAAGRAPQGSSNPFDQAVSTMQAKLGEAQQQYQQAQESLARQAVDSQATFAQAVEAIDRRRADAQQDFQNTMLNIANQRDVVNAQTEATISKAQDALSKSTSDLERKRGDIITKFNAAAADATDKFNQTVFDAIDKYNDALTQIHEKAADVVGKSVDQAREALHSLAQTMSSVISQQVQTAAQQSINLQNQQLAALGTPDTVTVGGITNAQRLQAMQQAGQDALKAADTQKAVEAARQAANDKLNQIERDAAKEQAEQQKALLKAQQDLTKSLDTATKSYDKTIGDLQEGLSKSFRDLGIEGARASSAALKAIQDAENARAKQLKALEEQQRQAQEKRDRALRDAEIALQKAEQDRQKRDAKLGEDQKKAEQAFLKARADAQKAVLEVLRKLPETMAEAMAARLNLSPQAFNFNRVVAVETQTDFIDAATARLRSRVQSGV